MKNNLKEINTIDDYIGQFGSVVTDHSVTKHLYLEKKLAQSRCGP